MGGPASLLPEDFGEGAGVPMNKNNRVQSAQTAAVRYVKGSGGGIEKVPWTTPTTKENPVAVGLLMELVDDEGNVYGSQFYSAGSPERGVPSENGEDPSDEGRFIIGNPNVEGDFTINKGTNLAVLINESLNAGYDKKFIKGLDAGDLTGMFTDLYAHWSAKKPEGREGLAGAGKGVCVPDQVIEMPGGGKSGSKAKAKAGKGKVEASEEDTAEALKKMVKVAKAMLKEDDEVDRADFVAQINEQYEDDDQLELMAELAYKKEFKKALAAKDIEIDGETIKNE